MAVAAHILNIIHGLAAALLCLAVFYAIGLLLTPGRWQHWMRWPDSIILGLTCYVGLCWVAISSRGIPLKYMVLVLAGLVWALVSSRPGLLKATVATRVR